MNLSEMVSQVRANIARDDKDALIKDWINEGLRVLARLHDWRELDSKADIQTTPGVEASDLPADFRVLQSVRLDGWLLQEIHPREIERLQPSTKVVLQGRPRAYAQAGHIQLRWFPVPDAAYPVEVRYSRWPSPLTLDTDTSEIENVDDLLVIYATADGFMHLQLYEDAAAWRAEWASRLGFAARLAGRRPGWKPGRMKAPEYVPAADAAFDPLVRRVL